MLVSLMSFSLGHSLCLSFCLSPIGFSVLHGGADIYYLVLGLRDGTPLKVWGIGVFNFGFPWTFQIRNESWIIIIIILLCIPLCVTLIGIIHTLFCL